MKSANQLTFKNPIKVECFDKDGNLKWTRDTFNGITDEGVHEMLDAMFNNSGSPATNWYVGLIDATGYSALDDGDTLAGHAGWGISTVYSNATNPEWLADAAASRAVSNSTTADFNINASGTIKGVFISSDSTKPAATGILWATALFSADATVANLDTLKITYTVSQPAS